MRRLFASMMALGLLGSVLGCHHTVGVCDCSDCCGNDCGGCGHAAPAMPGAGVAPIKPEPIKEMPKETDKPKVGDMQ